MSNDKQQKFVCDGGIKLISGSLSDPSGSTRIIMENDFIDNCNNNVKCTNQSSPNLGSRTDMGLYTVYADKENIGKDILGHYDLEQAPTLDTVISTNLTQTASVNNTPEYQAIEHLNVLDLDMDMDMDTYNFTYIMISLCIALGVIVVLFSILK